MGAAPFDRLRASFEVVPFQGSERRPQGLKPNHIGAVCGTTEVVPFQGDERPPQGLKPNHIGAVCGPTEVVPFYKAGFFRSL